MRLTIMAMLISASFCGCAIIESALPSESNLPNEFGAYDADDPLAGFRKINLLLWQPTDARSIEELMQPIYWKLNSGKGKESPSFSELLTRELPPAQNQRPRRVAQLSVSDFPDDHLSQERYRAILEKNGDEWQLVELGRQWRCRKAPGSGSGWTIELCP